MKTLNTVDISHRNQVDFFENMMEGLLLKGFSLRSIIIGLHNACAHGDLMAEQGAEVTEENLGKLFNGFDMAIEAAEEMDV